MATQDALELLRAAITANEPPQLLTASKEPTEALSEAAMLSFSGGSVQLAKDTPTRYTAKAGSSTEFYNVGQLLLAWLERQAALREYMMKAQSSGVGYVTTLDRRGVVEYLTGQSDGAGRVLDVGASTSTSSAPAVSDSQAGQEASQEASTSAAPTQTQPKRRYEPNAADREICKKIRASEVELVSRSAVLRTAGGGKENNFASIILPIAAEKIKAMRASQSSSSSKQQAAAPVASASSTDSRMRKAKQGHPIIMISSSPTSLITMWNVKKFLEQGIFEPSEVARANEAQEGNIRVEDVLAIYRKRTGEEKPQKYFVVEGPEALQKFGQGAWERVACVMTTGQAWQFADYKWNNPRELFRHVTGVYFQWNNEPANPNVKDWNVTELRIDRSRRHVDKQIVGNFWRVLDGGKTR